MSVALCKNRYYKDLIKSRRICMGMTKDMVESSWGAAWRKSTEYKDGSFVEVWEWGNQPHSRVRFDAEGKAVHIYSVASTGKDGWTRA